MRKALVIGFIFLIFIFFSPVFLKGYLPVPGDTLVGLYHPFRDLYAHDYPRGVPFKNFLITDPIRQIIPWKSLVISSLTNGQLPLWNPYEMGGTPLLANFQSSSFYPLNIVLLIQPFFIGWTILIILQPLLAGIFLYLYLRNLRLSILASWFGGIIFAFCGFSISWLEWGTVVHTILWLPLILLAKDKLLEKWNFKWVIIFMFAEISAVFAGHLQVLFYAVCVSNLYLFVRIWQKSHIQKKKVQVKNLLKLYFPFLIAGFVMILITSIQWFPTLQFILLSARSVDQADFLKPGWFIPWQNIVQFIEPDFFGNPSTLNYWGEWNYGEFIGYIGVIPFVTALFAIFFRRDKKTIFFSLLLFISLIFAFPTPFAQIPFTFHIPLLSTSQPTRLIVIADFALAILAALGFDYITKKRKQYMFSYGVVMVLIGALWIFIYTIASFNLNVTPENISTAKHNLYLPTLLLAGGFITSLFFVFIKNTSKKVIIPLLFIFILLASFDLIRFGQKFDSFSKKEYFYPSTKILKFLKMNGGISRIAATDPRILPPNVSTYYKIHSIEGYDPLYLLSYAEFIAALERGRPDISAPFGFNRIITPHNITSPLFKLLSVEYVLSLDDIKRPNMDFVMKEGETRVYWNTNSLPRAFFVSNVVQVSSKQDAINELYKSDFDMYNKAVVSDTGKMLSLPKRNKSDDQVSIYQYQDNLVRMYTQNSADSFLVFLDVFYPTWKVRIYDSNYKNSTKPFQKVTDAKIYKTDYTFRGVVVPKGTHIVEFYNTLF